MFALPTADACRPNDETPADGWTNPQADWAEPQFSPVKIAAVARVAAQAGVPPSVLLEGTGVDPARLQDADCKTSTAQLYRVLGRAAALCPLPDLGRRIGAQLRISSYGMYGYALLSAPSMQAVMDRALRFHALANPLVPIRAGWVDDAAWWQFPSRHELMLPELDERLYRLLIELQMATHVQLGRDVMGPWFQPMHVGVPWPAPADAGTWAAAFGCEPTFGAARGDIRYPAAWHDRAPQLANEITAAQTSRECARLLESLEGGPSLARRVYRELMRSPGRFPGIESIAESLHMTGRTLRRHLQTEGTSYADLLTRVRRALAEDYLRSTRMTIDDIAAALAFSDARSFRSAFLRWTGSSPSLWRQASAEPAARRA
jgi:AraC-like DNA-binding protein